MAEHALKLGVDLGGTKTAVSLWTAGGEKLESRRFQTLSGGPRPNIERIAQLGRELLLGRQPVSVGVSGGGVLDAERGVILQIPNLDGWVDVPLASELRKVFCAPVGLENDANACAIAEHRFGAGRGARHMAFLTLSTGIGGGLILDGRIHRGHRLLAGEIGHTVIVPDGPPCGCGQRGCLEALASGSAMARRLAALRERDPSLPVDAKDVVERARRGDPFSIEFLRETARYLAHGLANLLYILDVERFILGTIAVAAGDLLLGPLREELSRRIWPAFRKDLQVLPAGLGMDLGDWAAFAVAP